MTEPDLRHAISPAVDQHIAALVAGAPPLPDDIRTRLRTVIATTLQPDTRAPG
jgi:hypothetical protein